MNCSDKRAGLRKAFFTEDLEELFDEMSACRKI